MPSSILGDLPATSTLGGRTPGPRRPEQRESGWCRADDRVLDTFRRAGQDRADWRPAGEDHRATPLRQRVPAQSEEKSTMSPRPAVMTTARRHGARRRSIAWMAVLGASVLVGVSAG